MINKKFYESEAVVLTNISLDTNFVSRLFYYERGLYLCFGYNAMYKCGSFICAIHDTCMYREADYCKADFRVCHFQTPCEVCKLKKNCRVNLFEIIDKEK